MLPALCVSIRDSELFVFLLSRLQRSGVCLQNIISVSGGRGGWRRGGGGVEIGGVEGCGVEGGWRRGECGVERGGVEGCGAEGGEGSVG